METPAVHSRLIDPDLAAQRAAILRALGNPVRLRIVASLAGSRELTVSELSQALDAPQSSISRQLAWLRLHDLVAARIQGGFHYYSLAMPQLVVLLGCLEQCCPSTGADESTDAGDVN
jgi:DNA-binding transcriptional ArsR family regulator